MKSFKFEPENSSDEERSISNANEEYEAEVLSSQRIGNNDWCACGEFSQACQTTTESYCCRDTCEIPDDFFEGNYIYQTEA